MPSNLPQIDTLYDLDKDPINKPTGQGKVFRGRVKSNPTEEVAVKVLHRYTENENARILREIGSLGRFDGTKVVKVKHLALTAEGQTAIVSEWAKGGDLEERRGSLSETQTAMVVARIAEIMQTVHDKGVAHRDLKPSNVFLTDDKDWYNHVRVGDFGSSVSLVFAALDDDRRGGTPAYMAPELAEGLPDPDWRLVDVFGLGGILYHCLTGEAPLAGAANVTDAAARYKSAEYAIRPPRKSRGSAWLWRICLKCLQREPGKRYQTAQQVANDLRAYLRLWVVRWMATSALLFSLLIVVSGIASGWIAWQQAEIDRARLSTELEKARAEQAESNAETRRLQENKRRDYIRQVHHYAGLIKDSQQAINARDIRTAIGNLDACDPALRGWEWDYLRSKCNNAIATLKFSAEREPTAFAVHPDGQEITVAFESGQIERGPLLGARFTPDPKLKLQVHPDRIIKQLAYSTDGKTLIAASLSEWLSIARSTVTIWKLDHHTRAPVELSDLHIRTSPLHGGGKHQPYLEDPFPSLERFAIRGDLIAYAAEKLTAKIATLSGEPLATLPEHKSAVLGVAFSPDGNRFASVGGFGQEGYVRVWRGKSSLEPLAVPEPVIAVRFLDDERLAVLTSNTIRLLSISTNTLIPRWEQPLGGTSAMAWQPAKKRLLVAAGLNLHSWQLDGDFKLGRHVVQVGHTEAIKGLAFTKSHAFSLAADGVKTWDDSPVGKEQGKPEVRDVGLLTSENGKITVKRSEDRKMIQVRINGDKEFGNFEEQISPPGGQVIAMGLTGNRLLVEWCGTKDNTTGLALWDLVALGKAPVFELVFSQPGDGKQKTAQTLLSVPQSSKLGPGPLTLGEFERTLHKRCQIFGRLL